LLPQLFIRGVVTCFAYGQTGSGKTYTLTSVTHDACRDLFKLKPDESYTFQVGFFEIYAGKSYDLLNAKKELKIM